MQLCWNQNPEARPTAAQVQALINHLYITHTEANEPSQDDGYGSSDFEERWQRLKPNTIPKVDEHIAIIHAPSTSMASHFTGSDQELDNIQTIHDTLSVDMDTAVSRSSSIMSDKNPLSVQMKSESLTNLHGSLEDVRNIYLTHNETAVLECHQGNIILEETKEKEHDKSDSSVDPWLKDIMAGSQDDVSYFKDVSDVIKNLDNILNSEKTSSSESSHHASPSRDNLILDCKKDYPMQSSLVKSPGITNFQNILETGFDDKSKEYESCTENDTDRDTIGTLSHSFERHSDTSSQQTLENLTPDTPMKDIDIIPVIASVETELPKDPNVTVDREIKSDHQNKEIPKGNNAMASDNNVPKLKELCVVSLSSVSVNVEQSKNKDCRTSCDSKFTERTDIREETKSIDDLENSNTKVDESNFIVKEKVVEDILPNLIVQTMEKAQNNDVLSVIENAISRQSSLPKLEETSNFKSVPINNAECKKNDESKETVFSDLIENEMYGAKSPTRKVSSDLFIEIEKKERQKEENKKSQSESPVMKNNSHSKNDTLEVDLVTEYEPQKFNENRDVKPQASNKVIEVSLIESIDQVPELLKIVQDINYSSEVLATKPDLAITSQHDDMETSCTSIENEHKQEIAPHDSNEEYDLEYFKIFSNAARSQSKIEHSANLKLINESKIDELEADLLNKAIVEHKAKENESSFNPVAEKTMYEVDNELEIKHVESVFTFLQDESAHNSDSDNVDDITKSITELEEDGRTNEDFVDKDMSEMRVSEIIVEDAESLTKNKANSNFVQNEEKLCNQKAKNLEDNLKTYPDNIELISVVSPNVAESKVETDVKRTSEIADQIQEISIGKKEQIIEKIVQPNDMPTVKACLDGDSCPHNSVANSVISFKDEPLFDSLDAETTSINVASSEIAETFNEIAISGLKAHVQSPVELTDIDVSNLETHLNNSTIYMDLTSTYNELPKKDTVNNDFKEVMQPSLDTASLDNLSLIKNESTVYLDLPSFGISKVVEDFLHTERTHSSKNIENTLVSSTPIVSDSSAENVVENSVAEREEQNLSETNIPDYGPGVTLTKLEQTFAPESMSPFESPTKSHHTDTFDENSSVVLGPFENCSLELFKGLKTAEFVDFPREEVLAFSSNFSEMNLETPSPLRDGNFLNEVPDIAHDDFVFDNIATITEAVPEKFVPQYVEKGTKAEQSEPHTETSTDESGQSVTEKRVSPSTPPNSPGVFTAVTSQQKYLVDIDLNASTENASQPLNTLQNEIDLNQIELQITSKLAMAENENNLNIEYSGPMNVEGAGEERNDATPETYLAGNVVPVEVLKEGLTLDEECVQALRNELELKLPLAQVSISHTPFYNSLLKQQRLKDKWRHSFNPKLVVVITLW